ncbi:MAG: helix-turn-helix domain-containing protein [Lentilitoribacter sp.]
MSHAATNWAIQQRGLKPATKIVLWYLADCHNPSLGCFPSQEWLATNAEMSRSTINSHLEKLEKLELIERVVTRDPKTRKQNNTRYILAFERKQSAQKTESENRTRNYDEPVSEFEQNPCPENEQSRVRNPDTNPVRETVIEPVSEGAHKRDEDLDGKTQNDNSEQGDDPKKFEARVKKLGANHKGFLNQSTQSAVNAFAKLTDAERLEAEERHTDFIKSCKRREPMYLSTYFNEKKWTDLPPKRVVSDAERKIADLNAKPYSLPWMVWRMAHLMRGQEVGGVDCGSNPIRSVKDRAWPTLSRFDNSVAQSMALQLPERFHANNDAMVWVIAGSDEWQEWKAMFDHFGWPYIPNMFELDGANFPIGGPNGLHAFAKRMGIDWRAPDSASDGEAL